MAEADVTQFATRAVDTLSSGERARALLARALAVEAPRGEVEIVQDAYDSRADARPSPQRRHDLELMMNRGRLRAVEPPAAVLSPANLEATFAIRAAFGDHEAEPFVIPWAPTGTTPPEAQP